MKEKCQRNQRILVIDDVRMYDRALSEAEIAAITSGQ